MQRYIVKPRKDWEKKVEELGLIYHHTGTEIYWDESIYYRFSPSEIDVLETATNELERMSLEAVQFVIDNNRFADLGIPQSVRPRIAESWEAEPPSIYGRFDLMFDGTYPPKLLEYNADTPTGLLEASVAQWYWLKEVMPQADQFNSIHERLMAKWKELIPYIKQPVFFGSVEGNQGEDMMTVSYLRDIVEQAGIRTQALLMGDIGWDGRRFVGLNNEEIETIFKLYPWEWLIHEQFGEHLFDTFHQAQWIEPVWKMVLSNKGILAILWEMFPRHENLVEAYLDGPRELTAYVKKPKLSREGCNVTITGPGINCETDGDYGEEGFVYQKYLSNRFRDGGNVVPVCGSWVIDCESAGLGIRESDGLVTRNTSRFVPHCIV